ncbi:hypothetical protein TSOC_005096 [Tetrabaena socialis]|uniref:Uncharacterized protein n=1 Tax=Tetrabaena socialis TaxID=47790 RepID=A0A2J8A786_9CHLO|nr:hypothetical protein TSOC_005096 [Tetrabaena socialis]|eukprot:PNH08392.1 hypothetical protein TSOC_005096 [Tetrabaena socialis]
MATAISTVCQFLEHGLQRKSKSRACGAPSYTVHVAHSVPVYPCGREGHPPHGVFGFAFSCFGFPVLLSADPTQPDGRLPSPATVLLLPRSRPLPA